MKKKLTKAPIHPMGVTVLKEGVQFTAVIPNRAEAELWLYEEEAAEPKEKIALPDEFRTGDISSVMVTGLESDIRAYNYYISGKLVTDPYAKLVTVDDGGRKAVICQERYDWEKEKNPRLPYEDIIAYKVHVRGFTKHMSSKVKHKGTYQGVIEKIPYFKELGINLIELMPAYEFLDELNMERELPAHYPQTEEHGKKNYWGYGPGYYFAPKGLYSSSVSAIKEFKDMVKTLHEHDIEVVMEFYFAEKTNTLLIIDCLRYWMQEYHVDGFRLNEGVVPMEIIAADPLLSQTKLWSNGFDMGRLTGRNQGERNIAESNDGFMIDIRRFLKGDEDQLNGFLYRMRRNPKEHGIVNYVTNHNGFTLMDLVSYDAKHNELNGENNKDGTDYNFSWNCGAEGKSRKKLVTELRRKQIKNALAMLFFAQGTPMLLSGDELGNTQNGNNNSYCQDNEISWINWKMTKSNAYIQDFVKQLIRLRKEHPILHMREEMRIMDYKSCGYPDLSYHGTRAWYPELENYHRQVGIMYCGKYAQEEDEFFYFAYNMHWITHRFALPTLPKKKEWSVLLATCEENIDLEERRLTVPERTVVVLVSKDCK